MSEDAVVLPLFSRCSGELSTLCQEKFPRHPRLAEVFGSRLIRLNVSPGTARRFLETFRERVDIEQMADLDAAAEAELGREISEPEFHRMVVSRSCKKRIADIVVLALRLRNTFDVVAVAGITDMRDRRDVSEAQVQALSRFYIRCVMALKPGTPTVSELTHQDASPV